jgi:FkbM family methyltransferase
MGTKDTSDLFGLDELIIFAFYWANRNCYRCTLDIGANVGLHSIVMARCGFAVTAFEPDPRHFDWLMENLRLNQCATVQPVQAAVSDHEGRMEFVRVLGNTTGSHLAGAKDPYGELERFPVRVENFANRVSKADLVKIDAEGHEPEILIAAPTGTWERCDAMIEVGSKKNAKRIFEHFQKTGVNLFAQKIGWDRVCQLDQVPTSHHEGSLFISHRLEMPWSGGDCDASSVPAHERIASHFPSHPS